MPQMLKASDYEKRFVTLINEAEIALFRGVQGLFIASGFEPDAARTLNFTHLLKSNPQPVIYSFSQSKRSLASFVSLATLG